MSCFGGNFRLVFRREWSRFDVSWDALIACENVFENVWVTLIPNVSSHRVVCRRFVQPLAESCSRSLDTLADLSDTPLRTAPSQHPIPSRSITPPDIGEGQRP